MKNANYLVYIVFLTAGFAFAAPPSPPTGVDAQHFGVFSLIEDIAQPYTAGLEQCRGVAAHGTTLCPGSADCKYEIIVPYLLNNSTHQASVAGGNIIIVNSAKHTFPTTAPGDVVATFPFSGTIDFSLTHFPNFLAEFNVKTNSGTVRYKGIIQGPVTMSLGFPSCTASFSPSGYCYKDGVTGDITPVTSDMQVLDYATFKTYLIKE